MDISLDLVSLKAEGDFDPRGVKGEEGIDPRITEFRIKATINGPSAEQSKTLIEEFKKRCPVYRTLARSAPILFEIN